MSSEVFGISSDIFGYYRTPEKSWHPKNKECHAYKLKIVGKYTIAIACTLPTTKRRS